MSRKYKFDDKTGIYFISFAVVYWIDVFVRNEYKIILLNSWRSMMQNNSLDIYAWCIMPSHVHMIMSSREGRPESVVGEMKRQTSIKLRKAIQDNPQESRREWMLKMMEQAGTVNSNNSKFQFWQQHNQPTGLFSEHFFNQKLNYIHRNPVEAGFTDQPQHYLYSSARDYCGEQGLLEGVKVLY
jgi:REP element-mobilizing transposase RayT